MTRKYPKDMLEHYLNISKATEVLIDEDDFEYLKSENIECILGIL